jgi:GNAT superfamily N-acetyltransferase
MNDSLSLADGARYRIRPSGPQDRELLVDCFAVLSAETRRLRFFGHKAALSARDIDHLTRVDGHAHLALVAVRLDDSGREQDALGFIRCMRLDRERDTAELSIAVADHAHGQGVGAALLTRLVSAARDQGIQRLRCEVLAENAGMRRLAVRLGGEPRWLGGATLEYDCALPAAAVEAPRLPWFADPCVWGELCADAWLTGANDALHAARDYLDHATDWLDQAA